ncbi:NAD(P)/FAD-dependent oxidoreductase [Arthrospira platensis]|jgi:hypothetical protein|uniref:Amine oxidase domain-containing protein n=1 Tax=Limnospira platensis NIES-46 TaxID=1236695 RepID=A0A5M3T4Q3_LIMPL|nr:FAD-dependent oxidoreductase [Arthrospira platensis]KDR57890.1 FAD-dependent oxidoreductase [Arthrospira platensis str. Paraca]MBD2668907.1 FAD-dependent oxidoreductase [Arthrospira platensis FACHB-439]MBD2709343.1 FAD-dependent oxidoreductase [Arthrospira platensis FACHB-835]MDT9309699.1 FAD-dependent oxidoreductase [Limnospira sp. Paracas R14]QQW30345.1 FAD-dependent oxidoreductase [Arthrospira sp. PCC 9108]
MTQVDIIVIGAGIAGLICAQQLRRAGYSVVVVEKSRGVGGRAATRRVGEDRVDHGLRYLEPTGETVGKLITAMGSDLQLWTDRIYQFRSGEFQALPMQGCYICPQGMNGVGKFLATDLDIWFGRRVESITPQDNGCWFLDLAITADNYPETPKDIAAKGVVVAIPAPQALMLLESPGAQIPADMIAQIRSLNYDPSLAVMAGYSEDKWAALDNRNPLWKGVEFPEGDRLEWVSLDSSRRQNPKTPILVFHSTPKFARQYLDVTDLETPGRMLLQTASDRLFSWLNSPEWMQVHRWRYAFCQESLSTPCITTITPLPLVGAGDWCSPKSIDGVLQSGMAAADWVNSQLQKRPLPGQKIWQLLAAN